MEHLKIDIAKISDYLADMHSIIGNLNDKICQLEKIVENNKKYMDIIESKEIAKETDKTLKAHRPKQEQQKQYSAFNTTSNEPPEFFI